MEKYLPSGIWDNPTSEEQKAYQEFLLAWDADDSEYQEHYKTWIDSRSEETVRTLAYGTDCTNVPLNPYVCLEYDLISMWPLPCCGSANPFYDFYNNHHLEPYPEGGALYADYSAFIYYQGPGVSTLRNTDTEVLIGQNDFTVFFGAYLVRGGDTLASVGTDTWKVGVEEDGTGYRAYFYVPCQPVLYSRTFYLDSEAEVSFAAVKTDTDLYLFSHEGCISCPTIINQDCTSLDCTIDAPSYLEVDAGGGIRNVAIWNRALDVQETGNLLLNVNIRYDSIQSHTQTDKSFCFDYNDGYNHFGLLTNGAADAPYIETAGGVVEVGGEADESFSDVIDAGGIVEVGGEADEFKTGSFNEIMDGGAEAGGEADARIGVRITQVSSEIVHADNSLRITQALPEIVYADNSLRITQAHVEVIYSLPLGGVLVDGTAEESVTSINTYNETMDGGALVGGTAYETFDEHTTHNIESGVEIAFPIPAKSAQNRKPNCTPSVESLQRKGLVEWWTSNIPGGSRLYNPLGPDANVEVYDPDTVWEVDPERGYVPVYDGTNDYAAVRSGPENNPNWDITVGTFSAWVRADGSSSNYMGILTRSQMYDVGNQVLPFCIGLDNMRPWSGVSDAGVLVDVTGSTAVNIGEWALITATINGTLGTIDIYLNGEYQASSSVLASIHTNDQRYLIGAFGYHDGTEFFFNGAIDDVRIYNRVLTPQEIQQLYSPQTRYDLWFEPEKADLVLVSTALGVVVGGEADESKISTFNEIMDGGVVAGGIADEFITGSYDETMDGGAVVGGIADENFQDLIAVDGGVLVDGTANENQENNEITDSGVLVDGTANENQEHNEITDGGVVVDGTAEEDLISGSNTYDETMDGGVLVGGEATLTNDIDMEGGAVLGGIAEVTILGVLVGGEADYFAIFDPTIGENEWHFVARYNQVSDTELEEHLYPSAHDETMDCYIYLDDVNNILYWQFDPTFTPIDTIRFRGPADYNERGVTQIIVDDFYQGNAPVTADQADEIKAGLWYVFYRAWTLETYYILMRGQIVNEPVDVGGETEPSQVRSEYIEAGTLVGGSAIIDVDDGKYYEIMEGGAVVSGDYFQTYLEEGSAGARLGGKAYVDYKENQCPCVPTSRVLSLNELNFLDQQIFIQEMIDRSQRKGLRWNSIRVLTQFKAIEDNFEYFLTQTQFGITLDITKDGKFFGNFSSQLHSEIQDLFDEVVNKVKDDIRLKETLSMAQGISGS